MVMRLFKFWFSVLRQASLVFKVAAQLASLRDAMKGRGTNLLLVEGFINTRNPPKSASGFYPL